MGYAFTSSPFFVNAQAAMNASRTADPRRVSTQMHGFKQVSSRIPKMIALWSLLFATSPVCASPNLEQELSQIFVGRSFTIRDKSNDPAIKRNANKTIAVLERLKHGCGSSSAC